ncbi:hypothetical protein [Ketobacter alkanivorans]|jgi:hypothetical protein|nr:hypothetical protein [Ketobacter alkanivorans]|tara:strand:+ start:3594 stop:5012 length:1419 start_codon:yes stop_codon:yes gene_type:complete
MNEGWLYAHEFESLQNIQRRLFRSNPIFCRRNKTTIRQTVNRHIFNHSIPVMRHDCRCEYIYLPVEKNKVPSYMVPRRFDIHAKKRKSCPECEKLLFHCDVYNLDWLQSCPVHDVELCNQCPDCGREWSMFGPYQIGGDLENRCMTCGILSPVMRSLPDMNFKAKLSEYLSPTFSLVDLYLSNGFGKMTSGIFDVDRSMSGLNSKYLPSLLAKTFPGLDSFDHLIYHTGISRVDFTFNEIDQENMSQSWQYNERGFLREACTTLRQTLREITDLIAYEIKIRAPAGHTLKDDSNSMYLGECPYCTAFGVWYHHWHYAMPVKIGDIQLADAPNHAKAIQTTDGEIVELPQIIINTLFRNDLLHSFIEIMRQVKGLLAFNAQKRKDGFLRWSYSAFPFRSIEKYSDYLIFRTGRNDGCLVYKEPDITELLVIGDNTLCEPIDPMYSCYEQRGVDYFINKFNERYFLERRSPLMQ